MTPLLKRLDVLVQCRDEFACFGGEAAVVAECTAVGDHVDPRECLLDLGQVVDVFEDDIRFLCCAEGGEYPCQFRCGHMDYRVFPCIVPLNLDALEKVAKRSEGALLEKLIHDLSPRSDGLA